jgi:hypothetical protein
MLLRNFSLALFVTGASAQFLTYRADITALGGSGVTGTAVVFAGLDGSTVGYAGFAAGLGVSLKAEDCTATNGCGVHIHNGTSCADTAAQGGHYFVSPVTSDPWTQERYKSDSTGKGTYAGVVSIGTTDLKGRAFISKYSISTSCCADPGAFCAGSIFGKLIVFRAPLRVFGDRAIRKHGWYF